MLVECYRMISRPIPKDSQELAYSEAGPIALTCGDHKTEDHGCGRDGESE
jgi:hypothetical protein